MCEYTLSACKQARKRIPGRMVAQRATRMTLIGVQGFDLTQSACWAAWWRRRCANESSRSSELGSIPKRSLKQARERMLGCVVADALRE